MFSFVLRCCSARCMSYSVFVRLVGSYVARVAFVHVQENGRSKEALQLGRGWYRRELQEDFDGRGHRNGASRRLLGAADGAIVA